MPKCPKCGFTGVYAYNVQRIEIKPDGSTEVLHEYIDEDDSGGTECASCGHTGYWSDFSGD